MTEITALDPNLKNRILRYLHTGNELPKYFPGCWSTHKYFEVDKFQAIDEAFTTNANNIEVVNLIIKAYKEEGCTRFETIAFALSKCLLRGSAVVKEATYKAAAEICKTPEEMMLFNKYTRLLKTGNGRGWCKNVHAWYNNKTPMELAKEMTRVRARHGRSHKTLIRKSHYKVDASDQARDAVVKYAVFGFKKAKQLVGELDSTKDIFNYIQVVEDMRHCEDPVAAAAIATQHQFTLNHVPGHLLTSQEVWNSILPQMTLEELLYNIQRIHNMGFLTSNSNTTNILVSLLTNQAIIKKSKVTPIAVYIALNNYKKKSRPMKFEKAKVTVEKEQRRRSRQVFNNNTGMWEWTVTRRHPKELKNWGIDHPPNPSILASLNKLIDLTWLLTPPTNKRYLITMDMRHHMFKGRHFCKNFSIPKKSKKITKSAADGGGDADNEKKSKKHLLAECFYSKHVTPGHAAIILALQLLKREKNVDIAVFTEEGVKTVAIERNFSSIEEAEFVLRNATLGRVQLDAPIQWATKTQQKFDVFINMVDRTTRYMELDMKQRGGRGPGGRYGPPPPPTTEIPDHCPIRALYRYRKGEGVNDAKLIIMSLASHRVASTDGSHEGVLDVVGVDEHVPRLIDSFVLGHFN